MPYSLFFELSHSHLSLQPLLDFINVSRLPIFLFIILISLLPGLKFFPKQFSIDSFVANNLNTFVLLCFCFCSICHAALQPWVYSAIQLHIPVPHHCRMKTTKLCIQILLKIDYFYSMLGHQHCPKLLYFLNESLSTSSQQQFQTFNSSSNYCSTTLLLNSRRKSSSPLSQRNYSTFYKWTDEEKNPSILPTHTANPVSQNCLLLRSLSPLQFWRKLCKVSTSLFCSSHSSQRSPIIPFFILLISALPQAASSQYVFRSPLLSLLPHIHLPFLLKLLKWVICSLHYCFIPNCSWTLYNI